MSKLPSYLLSSTTVQGYSLFPGSTAQAFLAWCECACDFTLSHPNVLSLTAIRRAIDTSKPHANCVKTLGSGTGVSRTPRIVAVFPKTFWTPPPKKQNKTKHNKTKQNIFTRTCTTVSSNSRSVMDWGRRALEMAALLACPCRDLLYSLRPWRLAPGRYKRWGRTIQ